MPVRHYIYASKSDYQNLIRWVTVALSQDEKQFIVHNCPFCGHDHYHGSGGSREKAEEQHNTVRYPHCSDRRQDRENRFYEYRLFWNEKHTQAGYDPKTDTEFGEDGEPVVEAAA